MSGADFWSIAPQALIAAVSLFAVIGDFFIRNKRVLAYLTAGLLIPAFVLSLNLWFGWTTIPETAFLGTLAADKFASFFQILIIGITVAVILASVGYMERLKGFEGEALSLIVLAALGLTLLVSATELLTAYVAFELTALPVVGLAALRRDRRSIESAVKFLILSATGSAFLLFGIALIYGYTGSTYFEDIFSYLGRGGTSDIPTGSYITITSGVMLLAGFGFKMAVFPWQMWVPDVYQGAPTPVGAYLSTASKAAAFAVFLRLLYSALGSPDFLPDWSAPIGIIALLSMTYGNLGALRQVDIKRLMGYSTIAQAGYILVGVAAIATADSVFSRAFWSGAGGTGALYYLAGYAFSNLAVFLVIMEVARRMKSSDLSSFNGLSKRSLPLALFMAIGVLSLLGAPPTVGFISKVLVFGAAVNSDLEWLAVAGAVNSFVSAYYYLRIIRAIFLEEPSDDKKIKVNASFGGVVFIAATGAIILGALPFLLVNFAERALSIL